MADETVDIGNVGKGGVASEATLESLVKAVEFLAKKEGFDPKKSAEKAKKLAESFDDTITVVTDNRDALKENTEALDDNTSMLSKSLSAAGLALGVATVTIGNFAKELIAGGSNLSAFAQHIPGIGSLLTPLAGFLDETMAAFRDLSSVGGAFNNSLQDLRLAAANTYLSLDQFSNLIANRSSDLASFGGTVTAGAKRLVELNRGLGDQRQQLLNMGLSFEEINETLVDYATLNRAGARSQQRDAKTQAEAAAGYAKNLMTLSKLTGKDIDQIKEAQAAKQNDVAFQMEMSKLDEKERAKVNKAMATATALYGDAGAQAVKQAVLGMGPLTRETQIMAATMPEVYQGLTNIGRAATDASVSAKQFDSQMQATQIDTMVAALESAGNMEGVLKAGSAGLDGVSGELLEIFSKMTEQGIQFIDKKGNIDRKAIAAVVASANDETNARGAVTEQMNSFEENVREVRQALQVAFIDSGLLDLVVTGLKHFADFIGGFGETLVSITNQIKEGEWLSALGTALTDAISGAINNPGVVAAIAAIFAGPKLLSAAGAGASSLLSGLLPGGGGDDDDEDNKKNKRSRKVKPALKPSQTMGGKIGGNIGGLLGGIGGGLLEGITNALAGAGTKAPLIGLGAAAVGGAITLIGAGIAGATWLMGSALPTFAEGMKSFEDLDGARLKQAADGMIAMTGAMAAFGAGSVVSGVGNMIGSIAEGITSLFGGDDPLAKMAKFGDANINADGVQRNANAMIAFSEAMALGGVGAASSGAGNLLSTVANGLSGLLGGDSDPLDSIQRFASLEIDTQGVEKNAKAIKAVNTSMATLNTMFTDTGAGDALVIDGFSSQLAQFNANLDSDNIETFASSVSNLVDQLQSLNTVLAESQGLDVPNTVSSPTTTAGGNNKDRLNTTMDALLATSMQTSDYLKKIERNTKSMGSDVSKGRISDSRG